MSSRAVRACIALVAACVAVAFFGLRDTPVAHAEGPSADEAEKILSHIVITDDSKGRKPLPKIGVVPSIASDHADVTLHTVIRRDLDLCGEFEVLPDSKAPDGAELGGKVDIEAWKETGVEAVVKVAGKTLDDGKVQLKALAYFVSDDENADEPVYNKTLKFSKSDMREQSHRMADDIIGVLTGTKGAFASEMTFIYGVGKQRRAYIMDADGHDPHAVSTDAQLALAPAFDKSHNHYYTASTKKGAFKVYAGGSKKPLKIKPRGSVYGLTFDQRSGEVAIAIAQGATINLFRGPDLFHLKSATKVGMVLHPAWSPTGKLAWSGEGKLGIQQIFVDDRAVSPAGLHSSAPTFCRHPDGIKLVYMVGVGKNMDLVATGETGGGMYRLTAGMGRNMYPACSPDGRLVAFFSTRKSGPGLYIMRLDGTRPKRVSTLVGDSLRWSRLPKKAKKKKSKKKKK